MEKIIEKLKDKRVIIGIAGAVLLILAIVLICVFLKPSNTSVKLGETKLKLTERNNGISYTIKNIDDEGIIIAKNTTGKIIENIKANFTYYDESNNVVDTDDYENEIALGPNETTCLHVDNIYDHFDIEFTYDEATDATKSYYTGLTYIGLEQDEDYPNYLFPQISCGEEIIKSHMAFEVVYYKDDKAIDYDIDDAYSLQANEISWVMMSVPEDEGDNIIDYDRFEIFIVD